MRTAGVSSGSPADPPALPRQHIVGSDVGALPALGIQRPVADVDARVADERARALERDLGAGAQVDDDAYVEIVHQPADVGGGQALQVVGAHQDAGLRACRPPAGRRGRGR